MTGNSLSKALNDLYKEFDRKSLSNVYVNLGRKKVMSSELIALLETATPREERILRLLEIYEKRIEKLEEWQSNRDEALEYEERNKWLY